MSYASQADLVERFGERELVNLTDRSGTGSIDSSVLTVALEDASAEIDGYLAARYQLPLTSVPTVLVRVCADIARYFLHDDNQGDVVEARYKSAVALLKQLASGQVSLGLSDSGESPESNDGAEMQSGGRVWGRDDSKGFI
ncbi:phage protein Gp36 family protein [Marinobacter sp. MCTG268]|uniref:gp436 family protein n=1 Tax=Marinobacter adhaerens TaxID=1033846 RepID=UPI0005628A1C